MSRTRTYRTTAGATKAYGARPPARWPKPPSYRACGLAFLPGGRPPVPPGRRGAVRPEVCFISAGRDRKAALLHVVHDGRLYRREGADEGTFAGGGAAERGLELGVRDVHVRAPGDVRGLGRVLLGQRPEVRLVGEVGRRRGQRCLSGGVRWVDAAVGHQCRGRR